MPKAVTLDNVDVDIGVNHGDAMHEDATRKKDKTLMPSKGKSPEVDTPVPSALNEICSLKLGGTVAKFVPASEFCKPNLQYIKNMKEIELMVLDYAMCKETMDPRYGYNCIFIFLILAFL